jgi:hypothetical protein
LGLREAFRQGNGGGGVHALVASERLKQIRKKISMKKSRNRQKNEKN